jgi:dTDP-N-acetylfucosamine:lipid II N-acetylfucosaminyltransferase
MILHIMADSGKLINYPFIEFVNKNFNKKEHFFILCSAQKDIQKFENAITKDIFSQEEFFIENMKQAKKIILHGIWYDKLCETLLNNDELFKKIYWVMWGGDFYFPEKQSELKKEVIKRIRYFITDNKWDYKYLINNYLSNGNHIKCISYPSNIYKSFNKYNNLKINSIINIQIGNSADFTNNHINILEKLEQYKNNNIRIYAPLSYGEDKKYIEEVINYGRNIFEKKFIPITELMPFEKYVEFLSNIDIAIFAHDIQQAFGNIITLLGMGKKVYLKTNNSLWKYFQEKKIIVYDYNNLEKTLFEKQDLSKNRQIIKFYFSIENLKTQWKSIFMI